MTFPLLNISVTKWESGGLWDYVVFDQYIHTDKESVFNEKYKEKKFIDCTGKIYIGQRKVPMTQKCRNWFKFIPNVWKNEVIFQTTGQMWTVEELRVYVIKKVGELNQDEFTRKWISHLKKAENHAQLIFPDFKH